MDLSRLALYLRPFWLQDIPRPVPASSVRPGHIVQEEGTSLAQRNKLNFVGTSVAVTDDSANDQTVVTVTTPTVTIPYSWSDGWWLVAKSSTENGLIGSVPDDFDFIEFGVWSDVKKVTLSVYLYGTSQVTFTAHRNGDDESDTGKWHLLVYSSGGTTLLDFTSASSTDTFTKDLSVYSISPTKGTRIKATMQNSNVTTDLVEPHYYLRGTF